MVYAVIVVGKIAENFGLIEELGAFRVLVLQLDRHFAVVLDVQGQVYLPKGTRAQLFC